MNFTAIFKKKKEQTSVNNSQIVVQSHSFKDRISNMIQCGFSPKCIFDCGASVGHWSYQMSKLFPGVQILAIEPNNLVIDKTREQLKTIKPEVIIEHCAIGARTGKAFLNIWDNEHTKMSGSSLKEHVQGDPRRKMEVRLDTLDRICERHRIVPDLIKLDLQGGELDALKGASKILKSAEVVISEFGCLEAYVDRTSPIELMQVMYDNGYGLFDIIDLIYRPYDNALTGGDFIFVKNDSALREYKGYR